MKEVDSWIKEEAKFLRMAMGHKNESLDDFVEAHNTCLNDLMYFPTRHAYGLSSVAGNAEKLAALQTEFDNEKRRWIMISQRLKAWRRSIVFSHRVMRDGLQLFGVRLSLPLSR